MKDNNGKLRVWCPTCQGLRFGSQGGSPLCRKKLFASSPKLFAAKSMHKAFSYGYGADLERGEVELIKVSGLTLKVSGLTLSLTAVRQIRTNSCLPYWSAPCAALVRLCSCSVIFVNNIYTLIVSRHFQLWGLV